MFFFCLFNAYVFLALFFYIEKKKKKGATKVAHPLSNLFLIKHLFLLWDWSLMV